MEEGIPNKNLKKIGGISLVSWSIIHAKFIANDEDRIIVSSDSEKFQCCKVKGVTPLKRPKYLSGDKVFTELVMDHVLNKFKPDIKDLVVLLQPTSPLRRKQSLTDVIMLLNLMIMIHQ